MYYNIKKCFYKKTPYNILPSPSNVSIEFSVLELVFYQKKRRTMDLNFEKVIKNNKKLICNNWVI